MAKENQEKHWVEDLFPPKFTFENHSELCRPISDVRNKLDKLLDRLYRRDMEAIRDVYIRVLSMAAAEEQVNERAKIHRYVCAHTQTDLTIPPHHVPSLAQLNSDDGATSDCPSICVWSETELTLLRSHYKKEHDSYLSIKAELTDCQRRLNKATEELANSKLESEQLRNSSAETVARRLSEVNKALRLETVRITNQLNQCEKELHEEKTQRRFYEARVTELEADYSKLLIQTKLQKQKTLKVRDETVLENDRQISSLTLKYESEIADLIDRLHNLQESLDEERRLHARSRLGLDQLRLHFSQSAQTIQVSNQMNPTVESDLANLSLSKQG